MVDGALDWSDPATPQKVEAAFQRVHRDLEVVERLESEDIRRWRRQQKPGHTRHAYPFMRPGRRDEPRQYAPLRPDEGYVEGDAATLTVAPKEKGIRDPRETRDLFMERVLKWARAHPAFMLERARVLKATSPLQFAHMTDEQLADELVRIIEAKAQAGVELAYKQNGWDRPLNMDLVHGEAV